MDLRYEMVKTRKQLEQCCTNPDVVTEAKRLTLQEVATLAAEKELLMIDKEINLFKKKMEPNGKQLSDQIKGSQLNAHKRNRLNQSRSNSVTDVKNVLFSSCYISNSELFSHMRIKTQEINHSPIVEFLMTDISPKNEETKALTNTDVTINDGAVKGIISEIKENSMNLLSSGFVYNRQDLVCSVWKKWKSCTIDKKLSTAKDHISETQNMSKTAQRYINNKVMRKCWDTWFHMVREKKRALSAAHGKQEREEKIKRFLKVLQEQKQSLIAIKAPAIIKDVCNIKKDSAKNSQYSYHNFPSINKGQNKQNIQDNVGLKTKTFPSHLYNDYQRRFEVQQNIIAEQKSKLEEQSKLIKELQLAHMRLQTEKSTIEAQAEIHKTLSSCDLRLKPKAKQVKSTMSTGDKRMEFPEDKPVVVSLKTVPTILNRMEERAQEREKRWRLIKERKQKLIEEKERGKREEEEEKKRKEECEKRQKIEELKEKRRLEKQIEVQKKREREKMHYLIIQATIQYKKLLMKKVILSFKQLVVLKWKLMEIAEKHYKTKLLCNSFQTWRIHVQSVISLRMYEVTALYNRILMKKVFRGLFQVYSEYIAKNQVAIDFYNLCLQEHIFIGWYHVACAEHVVRVDKQEQATAHCNRKLLTHYLRRWQQFPAVLQMEREKEQRKQIWRRKVQEILPDFNPDLTMLEGSRLKS